MPERRTSPRLSEIAWTRTTASSRSAVGSGTGTNDEPTRRFRIDDDGEIGGHGLSPSGGKNTTRTRLLLDIGPARSFDSDVTERKPAGKSWESWREELIQLAHEEGAFDNLPGAGKPLPTWARATIRTGG